MSYLVLLTIAPIHGYYLAKDYASNAKWKKPKSKRKSRKSKTSSKSSSKNKATAKVMPMKLAKPKNSNRHKSDEKFSPDPLQEELTIEDLTINEFENEK